MSNLNEGNAFLNDVSYSVCILMCGYCEAPKDDILECQSTMKTLFFFMMLIIVYIFHCAGITKQHKIKTLNVKPK
jgi:hypothetical protein